MKTIIAGSRNNVTYMDVFNAIEQAPWKISSIISGNARGADKFGELFARKNNIPLQIIPADWDKYGRAAGPIRNRKMSIIAEALIAVWDGVSKGTKDMIKQAENRGLKVFIYKLRDF